MAEGNNTFLGGAVPLEGESEIFQKNLAIDILTITGKAGQTGDFLVLQNSGGTERFVVDKDGDITLGGDLGITGSFAVTGSSVFTGAITQTGGDITLNGDVSIANSLTVTGASAFTGNIDLTGRLVMAKTSQAAMSRLHLALLNTFPTSAAACSTGDLFMVKCTTDIYSLALCVSGAASSFKRLRRNFDVTIGSAS